MFTGIIIEKGQVIKITRGLRCFVIAVKGEKSLKKALIGSSISVNGVCLTVTRISGDIFEADVMPETVKRTNLMVLNTGSLVNLEPALSFGDEMGGHMVTGHIDGTGSIVSLKKDDNAIWMTIEAPVNILNQIVLKGSISLDGVSLTVADINETDFSVSLIPLTAKETILGQKRVGDSVNIETDIIGKYVEKYISAYSAKSSKGVTLSMLQEHGFA